MKWNGMEWNAMQCNATQCYPMLCKCVFNAWPGAQHPKAQWWYASGSRLNVFIHSFSQSVIGCSELLAHLLPLGGGVGSFRASSQWIEEKK